MKTHLKGALNHLENKEIGGGKNEKIAPKSPPSRPGLKSKALWN